MIINFFGVYLANSTDCVSFLAISWPAEYNQILGIFLMIMSFILSLVTTVVTDIIYYSLEYAKKYLKKKLL
jgi:hypothetical protein